MKKSVKILSIILLSIMLLAVLAVPAYATDSGLVDSLMTGGNANTTGIQNVGKNIISIITTVGIIVAVVVLLVLGIKYMMGSAAEKAEYKKTMIPYLVGAVIVFGASAIAKAVIAMSQSITA